MSKQIVECQTCKAVTKPELRGSTWISFVLFWFFAMIPGVIYMIWRRGGLGVCANCKSSAVIPYVKKTNDTAKIISPNTGTRLVAHDAFSYAAGERITIDEGGFETKSCPFCAESIRKTAIKCKHCGTMLDE